MPHAPRTHLAMAPATADLLFDAARRERFASIADAGEPLLLSRFDDPTHMEALAQVETLVTGWGAPLLDIEALDRMPRLRAVFHAAGTVRDFATDAVWDRDILVTSAADANAVPVAEYTYAAIVLATKRAFAQMQVAHENATGWYAHVDQVGYGNLGRTIGVVGFSRTGRRVVDKLRQLDDVRILVADPYADPARVTAAGAELLPLDELLPLVDVLSLHAPSLASTRHMIAAPELAALHDGAILVNTARGSLIDHDALAAECRAGRLDAVLDVTEPEPLPSTSPLLGLPNVAVTPHLAGSLGGETRRLADAALDELAAFASGRGAMHPVNAHDMEVSA